VYSDLYTALAAERIASLRSRARLHHQVREARMARRAVRRRASPPAEAETQTSAAPGVASPTHEAC